MSASSTTIISNLGSIQAYNRGPLTAVFTPPATCLSTLTYGSDMYFGHQGAYYDTACFPASLTPKQTQGTLFDSWALYYYSPGQCPSGWSHATTISSYFSGAWESPNVLSLGADTTAVLCCPSGFSYPSDGQGHQCLSTIISGATLTYFEPTIIQDSVIQGSVGTTTIGTGLYNIYGDGIPIWWQSSDLAAFSAASLITSSLSSPTPTTTASSSPIVSTPTATGAPSPSPSSPGSSGLSTGAKVAIGVCIPVAAIAVLFGIFYFFRYRKRKEPHHQVPLSEGNIYNTDMNDNPKVQVFSENLYELPNERPVAEIGPNEHTGHLGTGQQLPFTSYR